MKMSQKTRNSCTLESINCEKYLNRLLRQEKLSQPKKPVSPFVKPHNEKPSFVKQPPWNAPQLQKHMPTVRAHSPVSKRGTSPPPQIQSGFNDFVKLPKQRHRSASISAADREPWAHLLLSNRSKEKVSSFGNFDPLRTLHFLAKELKFRLQNTLPEDSDVQQMVTDIQHALKRIPPEVASLIHLQQASEVIRTSSARSLHDERPEKLVQVIKANTEEKHCQTPPTLNQEDTEKLRKIMEESTAKLESSCKQLEMLCLNLQNENESLERQLEEEREHVRLLRQQVRELQGEIDELSEGKIKQLELEKHQLHSELTRLSATLYNNPSHAQLKDAVEEVEKRRAACEQKYSKLQYDLTLVTMEKEKFATMLAIRDREVKEIQEEMTKVQDEVAKQLMKLNKETVIRVSSVKSLTGNWNGGVLDNKENGVVGDSTISSITSDRSMALRELPSGDATVGQDTQLSSKVGNAAAPCKSNATDFGALLDEMAPLLSM